MQSGVHSSPFGPVAVTDDLTELVGAGFIDASIDRLRMGGGNCKLCHDPLQPTDHVSLVAHLTSADAKVGFLHFRCGPPQAARFDPSRWI